MRFHFLKTVWSDIILLQENGRFALVDTGTKEQFPMIRAYLEKENAHALDLILLTHFHRDHYGSLPLLLKSYPVGQVVMQEYSGLDATAADGSPADEAYRESERQKYRDITALTEKRSSLVQAKTLSSVPFGDHCLHLFNTGNSMRTIYEDPTHPETYHRYVFSENQNSLAVFAKIHGKNIFLGGDMLDLPAAHPLADHVNRKTAATVGEQIDLYKAPHHGTNGTAEMETLSIYRPRIAVITNGEPWLSGYGTERDLRRVNPDVHIYRTQDQHVIAEITEDGRITVIGKEQRFPA